MSFPPRRHRHDDLEAQHRALSRSLQGHYTYFGVTSNYAALSRLREEVRNIWRTWLSRRSQRAALNWTAMLSLLKRLPLPRPRIVHRYVHVANPTIEEPDGGNLHVRIRGGPGKDNDPGLPDHVRTVLEHPSAPAIAGDCNVVHSHGPSAKRIRFVRNDALEG
jgi:hypothetical protein